MVSIFFPFFDPTVSSLLRHSPSNQGEQNNLPKEIYESISDYVNTTTATTNAKSNNNGNLPENQETGHYYSKTPGPTNLGP